MNKYDDMKKFIRENFMQTTNKKDRLHTQDILDILSNKKFLFSTSNTAKVFKSMKLGEHTNNCYINSKSKAGYYYLVYTGDSITTK